jgi:hypothetical protein
MPPIPYDQVSASPDPARRLDPIVSIKDAAVLANCHPQTLKNEARRGRLTLVRISERRIGVRSSELKRFLAGRAWRK